MALLALVLVFAIAASTASPATVASTSTSTAKSPAATVDPKELAAVARALVNASSWGVVSINYLAKNSPFGNALSYSDGGSGTPYFYLTLLDMATAMSSRADAQSALTLTEYALGTCGTREPQEPTCVKVKLSGVVSKII